MLPLLHSFTWLHNNNHQQQVFGQFIPSFNWLPSFNLLIAAWRTWMFTFAFSLSTSFECISHFYNYIFYLFLHLSFTFFLFTITGIWTQRMAIQLKGKYLFKFLFFQSLLLHLFLYVEGILYLTIEGNGIKWNRIESNRIQFS